MNNLIKQDQDKLRLFEKFGYDLPKARKFILTKAKISGGRILEVGTGEGHMAVALAENGLKVVSIDLDRKAQKTARLTLKSLKLGRLITLKIMNAERLQYKDGSFDCVISVNFIHHARDPVRCLKEMIRVTRDRLIIADINKRGERIMEKMHRLDGRSHAVSKMSIEGIGIFLKRAGMKIKVYRDACQAILIGTQKSPVLKPGMNARRLSADASVADNPGKKPRALARGDSLVKKGAVK